MHMFWEYIFNSNNMLKFNSGDMYMGIKFENKKKKNYEQFTIRFEEGLLDKIRKVANDEKMSINEVVNQSVQYALRDR